MEVDGGYGWVVTAATFFNNAHHWGIISSYGVFLSYFLTHNDFPDGNSLDYAFVGGLSASQAFMIAPLAAIISRRVGLKLTLALGIVLETAALLGASWATQTWQLYLSQGVCFGWGLGLQYVSTIAIIPQWFTRRRSLAAGIAAAGSGTGGLLYSLLCGAVLLPRFGPGWTYRILCLIQLVVNTVCLLLLRDRNKITGTITHSISLRHLVSHVELWLLLGWAFFSTLGFMVIWYSLDDFSRSIGLSAPQGSIVTAVMNLGQVVGRPLVGYFSDAVGRLNMASLATGLTALLSLLLWTFARSYASTLCFAFFAGMVFGAFFTVVSPVATEVVGLEYLSSCLTIVWLTCVAPATFGEPIALELRTVGSNDYLHVELFTGFIYVGATICVVLLRQWKVIRNEDDFLFRTWIKRV
ncbi:hypothetical protein ASPZODRAFT_76893 [Penicilliopsis zonata CBS 506.65]|uniref:Major facilitator superfamily (MFS) profile domain-containing protein n=1 Tax=Penicilliopsis zonata CBS 506.65 TaxID=1073090 RepID=A0A1L9S5G4_9EURO|nr:hypothetical protein ASPZODRAFT_76893 [Penicilliopsis zonata CBS 506.65]OJJ42390.1 hypothetical protein ASPZODRAFT_76893 [Penicilliopsis zonata CBS 506.65]